MREAKADKTLPLKSIVPFLKKAAPLFPNVSQWQFADGGFSNKRFSSVEELISALAEHEDENPTFDFYWKMEDKNLPNFDLAGTHQAFEALKDFDLKSVAKIPAREAIKSLYLRMHSDSASKKRREVMRGMYPRGRARSGGTWTGD